MNSVYQFLLSIVFICLGFNYAYGKESHAEGDHQAQGGEVSNEVEMLEMLGYMTVYRDGLKELGFDVDDANHIARGLKKALEDDVIDNSFEAKMPEFQEFIENRINISQKKREKAQASVAVVNIAEGEEFLDSLKTDERVKISSTGLHYKIIEPGKLIQPTISDTVRVHYKGTRIDGTEFDSSYKRGEPVDFPLSGVVPGFSEGLMYIGEGGKIILYIPSELAYGNNPRPGGVIQPGDTLIFECELVEINP